MSCDLEALLVDGPYDLVLCCEVIYRQVPEVLEALAHTQLRLVAPGGRVLVGYEFRGDLIDDMVYFEAAAALLGEPATAPLRTDAAWLAAMTGAADDADDERTLYTYTPAAA